MRRWWCRARIPVVTVAVAASAMWATGCGGPRSPRAAPDPVAGSAGSAGSARPSVSVAVPAPTSSGVRRRGAILNVPSAFPSVQAAVDDAQPGDLVRIAPGVYTEAVVVRVPDIVIRGADRNSVIFDGGNEIDNGITVAADGVAVENLTLRRYTFNGLLFTKAYDDEADAKEHTILSGYRASYVTAHNNGAYGVYAFFARGGVIEHTYTSGHPDSGVYVGQCKPCDAVVTDNVSELNAIGYSGTNASGNLFIVNSVWRRNRIGMTPNSQDQEQLAPQGDVVIAGNLVADNQDPGAPSTPNCASGFGIAVSGGERNRIVRNRVLRNATAGIALTDLNAYQPSGNAVTENVLAGNGTDLVYAYTSGSTPLAPKGNCFAKNVFTTSLPERIESVLPCDAAPGTPVTSGPMRLQPEPPDVDYRTIAYPPDQPTMPDAATAPATPASRAVPDLDLSTITVPR